MYECIYENGNIRLRKATIKDAHSLHTILNNQKVMEFYGESGTTFEDAEAEIKWFNALFDNNGGRWVIEDYKTGQYIGDIGVFAYDSKHKKGEIGYKLGDHYWGKGIMSHCIQAVLKVAFEDWGYNRVEAMVDVRNNSCIKLLLKNNFVKEGVLRDYEFEYGHFVDLEMHSILQREFHPGV